MIEEGLHFQSILQPSVSWWHLSLLQSSAFLPFLFFFFFFCIFLLCRNTKGFCHMFSKGRGFNISAAFLWKRIFAPCFTTQATEHCPILINESRVYHFPVLLENVWWLLFDFLTFFLRKFLPIRLSCCLCWWARVTFIDFILCLLVWSPKQNEGLAFNKLLLLLRRHFGLWA